MLGPALLRAKPAHGYGSCLGSIAGGEVTSLCNFLMGVLETLWGGVFESRVQPGGEGTGHTGWWGSWHSWPETIQLPMSWATPEASPGRDPASQGSLPGAAGRSPVALVIHRHEVHEEHVVGHGVHAEKLHLESREHTPGDSREAGHLRWRGAGLPHLDQPGEGQAPADCCVWFVGLVPPFHLPSLSCSNQTRLLLPSQGKRSGRAALCPLSISTKMTNASVTLACVDPAWQMLSEPQLAAPQQQDPVPEVLSTPPHSHPSPIYAPGSNKVKLG